MKAKDIIIGKKVYYHPIGVKHSLKDLMPMLVEMKRSARMRHTMKSFLLLKFWKKRNDYKGL
jgi:hypothetical protein